MYKCIIYDTTRFRAVMVLRSSITGMEDGDLDGEVHRIVGNSR
jgi:hypothetical protein